MSEGERERGSKEESVKLFVGQVPKHMSESQLLSFFKDFALVDEVSIIKDRTTRASRGCCFVICPSRQDADKAVNACHNKKTLPGASSPLQVKYADGEMERLEHKLFVGMLPKNISEAEVSALFTPYGTINDLQILRGCQQATKGCAFLKYETKEQAVAALEAMNGKYIMEGSGVPLVVKWADTEKERRARKAQKTQSQSSNPDSQHASLFGALPLGYVPPYNGYGYQAPAPFGYMQYRLPTMQNHLKFHDMRGMTPSFGPGLAFRNYPLPSTSYGGSAYSVAPAIQYPMSYSGGLMSPRPLGSSPFSLPHITANSTSRTGKSSGTQIEGPTGANLFICHIPQDFDDEELANTFQAFGSILSAKVFVDKATGASKCFGFVSYDSPEAAQSAINTMNGSQLGGKKLKVQVKRENGQNSVSVAEFEHLYWSCGRHELKINA